MATSLRILTDASLASLVVRRAEMAQRVAAVIPGSMLTGNVVTLPASAAAPTASQVAALIDGATVANAKVVLPNVTGKTLSVKPGAGGVWASPAITAAERAALDAIGGWAIWWVAPGGASPTPANGVVNGDVIMVGGQELDPTATLNLTATGRSVSASATASAASGSTATIARYIFEVLSTTPTVTRTDSNPTSTGGATFEAAADGTVRVSVIAVDSDGRSSRAVVKDIAVSSVSWIATDDFTGTSGAVVGRAMNNALGGSTSITPTGAGAGAAPVLVANQLELTYPYTLTYPLASKNIEVSFEVGTVAGGFHLYPYYANTDNFARATVTLVSGVKKLNVAAKTAASYVAGSQVDLLDGDVVTMGWDSTVKGYKLTITRSGAVFWTATTAASLNNTYAATQVGVVIECTASGKQHLDNLAIKAVTE